MDHAAAQVTESFQHPEDYISVQRSKVTADTLQMSHFLPPGRARGTIKLRPSQFSKSAKDKELLSYVTRSTKIAK
jgi:hypothetical protein